MPFPVVQAATLAGQALRLPTDLANEQNVLLVLFSREQQIGVNSWIPYVKRIEQLYDTLGLYEVLVLGRAWFGSRAITNARLRADIPNPSLRARTIPLYVDRATFLRALDLAATPEISVLLVDREGHLSWSTRGQVTPDKVQALAQAIADTRPRER